MKQRWKKGMAWLLSALCILVTVQIPSIPAKAARYVDLDAKIQEFQKTYPHGWVPSEGWDSYSYQGTSWSCVAFSHVLFNYLYGVDWTTTSSYTNINEIEKGDYIN